MFQINPFIPIRLSIIFISCNKVDQSDYHSKKPPCCINNFCQLEVRLENLLFDHVEKTNQEKSMKDIILKN